MIIKMIPLTRANIGETNTIVKIDGRPEIKKHLESLGFVAGGNVTILTTLGSSLIISVKESRVAVNKELAQKIMI